MSTAYIMYSKIILIPEKHKSDRDSKICASFDLRNQQSKSLWTPSLDISKCGLLQYVYVLAV